MDNSDRILLKARTEKFLEECWRADWMSEEDWDKCLSLTLGEIGPSLDGFVDHVVTGIENGYTVDVQFAMCREVIKAMGHE